MLRQAQLGSELAHIEIRYQAPLSEVTFTKVGGPADFLAYPKDLNELQELVAYANTNQIPWLVLGNASNLIVRDSGIKGFVILLEHLNKIEVSGYTIEAQAGANLIETCKVALTHSLTGMEFASGIPGSIGGAVFMNAGAYGGEMSHVIASVKVLTREGQLVTMGQEELAFGYRHSKIQDMAGIVISAKFQLSAGVYETIEAEMARLNHLRALKQPLEYPSCGSVFKRPVGHFAGQLIQEAGLQGHRIGGVEVSKKHAGFMVNVDNGKASDYEALIAHVIKTVEAQSGVRLEPEVRILGE